MKDLPLFTDTIPGGWVGGDSNCIEAPGSLYPIDTEWQHVSIPLKSLIDSSTCKLKSITYLKFNKDYGASRQIFTAWVNNIRVISPDSEKIYAAVKVNQVGYTERAEKCAIVSCFDGVYDLSENTNFSVKRVEDGSVVYRGSLRKIADLDKDVSGGWYDAGDFGKYTNAGATAVSDLLWAYELFPDQFTDKQLNIPESGNGIPDILDEAKYEIDFLLKIQDTDGGFFHRVQGGTIKEDNKRYIMDTENGRTLLKPTAHTGSAAGMLAHASVVFRKFNKEYAKRLLNAAESGWRYLEAHPELVPSLSGPYDDDNDKDDRFYAAASLFHATHEKKYGDYFLAHYKEFSDMFDNPSHGHSVGDPTMTAFFHYAGTQADPAARSWFSDKYSSWRGVQLGRAYNNPWRNSFRFYDYYWGSNMPVLCTSMDLVIGSKLFGKYDSQVINVVRSNLNYVLGVNPMAFSYVSGFGDNSMKNTFSGIYNSDGKTGIPDGYMAGGANMYEGSWFSRFGGKSYNDINTEWTTNEHTIYWNSGLVFSAALVNEENRKKSGNPAYATVFPEKRVLEIGESAQIRTIMLADNGKPIDLTGAEITYISNKPGIATIDETGKVTGLKQGTETITVTVRYGTMTLKTTTVINVRDKACNRDR